MRPRPSSANPSSLCTSVGKRMRFGMRRSNRNSTTTTAASWRPLAPSYFPGATPSLSKTHTFSCESWRTGLQSVLRSVLRSGLPKPLLYINQRIEDVLHATLFLAAARILGWPGATPHFEGRSRPTLQRYCMHARSIISCRFCRRLCEAPDEESYGNLIWALWFQGCVDWGCLRE